MIAENHAGRCSFVGFVRFSLKTHFTDKARPLETRSPEPVPSRHCRRAPFFCSARDKTSNWSADLQSKVSRRDFCRVVAASVAVPSFGLPPAQALAETHSVYDIVAVKHGRPFALEAYRNKLTLFVNVASYCALTPQYEGLVALHDKYQPQGFEIVASPCDQFGRQEPGSNQEICAFAKQQFGAKFLLLDKLNVNDGPQGVSPLYKFLKDTSPEGTGQRVSWNFEKFLVGVDGKVLRRYKPGILPENIEGDIKWALDHLGEVLPPKKKPTLGVE